MAVTLPYHFRAGEIADADEVNANFDALYDWINLTAKHKDTVNPFTTLPSLPSDPTTANQMTRLNYAELSPYAKFDALEPLAPVVAWPANDNTNKFKFEAGWKDVVFAAGAGTLTFVTGFSVGCAVCLVTLAESTGTGGSGTRLTSVTLSTTTATLALNTFTGTARILYIALGA